MRIWYDIPKLHIAKTDNIQILEPTCYIRRHETPVNFYKRQKSLFSDKHKQHKTDYNIILYLCNLVCTITTLSKVLQLKNQYLCIDIETKNKILSNLKTESIKENKYTVLHSKQLIKYGLIKSLGFYNYLLIFPCNLFGVWLIYVNSFVSILLDI